MSTSRLRLLPLLLIAAIAAAGTTTPLAAQSLVLEGGTIHTLVSEPFVGNVVIENGRIRAVGAGGRVPTTSRRLNVDGLNVYPGLFDAMSQLGLVEITSIAATVDTTELGGFNPQLEAVSAVHPASEVLPVTRANGITHALVAPSAGGGRSRSDSAPAVIPGQAGLVHLAGWTVEEMAIEPALAMVITWPAIRTRTFDMATFSVREANYSEAKKEAEERQQELRDWLEAARHYARAIDATAARTARDLKLEALARVLDGGQQVIVIANRKRDIEAAVAFAEEEGLRMVLGGGRQAWQVKELLAEKGIPVLLGLTQSLPEEEDDPYDRPFRNPLALHEAGVPFAFASGGGGGFGPGGPHSARTLPYEAATAVAYGLPHAAALRAITLSPAEILGVDDRLGSIETGKIANLMVTDGDPLEITTRVHHLIIGGQEVETDNKHRQLYERYRSRPEDSGR